MAAPRKENIKDIILDTTQALLKTQSFSELSLAEIAKAAGISKGTLYYHYKTKSEIIFGLTDRYLSAQWDDLIAWTENKEKDTSISRLIKYVMERNVASAGFRLQLLADAQMGDEEVRKKLIARYAEFETLISKKIAERTDIPADFLTWLLLLASDGMIVQEALHNENFCSQKFIADSAAFMKYFTDSIEKKSVE